MSNRATSTTSPSSNEEPLSRPTYHGHQMAIWVFIATLHLGEMTGWAKWAVTAMALFMVCYHLAHMIRKT